MSRAEASLKFLKGVAHLNGNPFMFNSSDYPYYRDDARNWEHRLGQWMLRLLSFSFAAWIMEADQK